jgi:hydroxymethylpyrimidine pyrophosphatase-like HAD family hydrolase
MKEQGWIALDIDGTITHDKYAVPLEVAAYLRSLSQRGWSIVFATGRSLSFALRALSGMDFPFTCLPQNGSAAVSIPGQQLLFKHYLSPDSIASLDWAFEGLSSDYILYGGFERKDQIYYRPSRFLKEESSRIKIWQEREKEPWKALDEFSADKIGPFPLAKAFGPLPRMKEAAERLRQLSLFEVAFIRDPFAENEGILLITDPKATKGAALKELLKTQGKKGRVIAAGDDDNDRSLLECADVKIAMPHAPSSLLEMADFLAPPTSQNGIIYALQIATQNGT